MIERIHKNGQRLLLLINEVLDLARIEAGRMEIVSAPFDLHDMAGQWKSQMEVLAQEKGLDFTVTVDDKLPAQIVGDKDRITQIVVNLLSNAFKFTEKGAVDLTITGRTNSWVISVADTGIGIPPHALNYIFDEFRQVDGSSKRMYGGSGLGLAIVRNLCRLLNGKVSVTSEVGLGSVFTVTLPLEVSVAEMPAEMAVE
jgi:signal transduction histidine kinase